MVTCRGSVYKLRFSQELLKRVFDFCFSIFGLSIVWWLIILTWCIAAIDTRANGFFRQPRVGRHGELFLVIKIRTMRIDSSIQTTVTRASDPRITGVGRILRKYKLDELPQLWNVLNGDMSFVGPRPDVAGYADRLPEEKRAGLLSVRPGITGPATLAYRNEEELLALHVDPQKYNDEVIYPDKVRINLEYIQNWRFRDDLRYIWKTVFG